MKKYIFLIVIFVLNLFTYADEPTRGWLTVEKIMQDPVWMGTSPQDVFWSEDGAKIYFKWRTGDDEGDSLYVVPADGGIPESVSLDEYRDLPSRRGDYNRHNTKKVYEKYGDIFLFDIQAGEERQLTNTLERNSNPQFTPAQNKITFERNDNFFTYDLESGLISQLTNIRKGRAPREENPTEKEEYLREQELALFEVLRKRERRQEQEQEFEKAIRPTQPEPYYIGEKSVSGFVLSPDERYITLTLIERDERAKPTIVPNYITESGYTETIRSRSKTGYPSIFMSKKVYDTEKDTVYSLQVDMLQTNDRSWENNELRYSPVLWSPDGRHAMLQIFSSDNKHRWIVTIDPAGGDISGILEYQHDEAWIRGPGIRGWGMRTTLGWMPDSKHVYFQSEETGYSHLYIVDINGENKQQLTSGTFEVYRADISRDEERWYITTNEEHFGERHLYSMPLYGGERTKITSLDGRNDAYISPGEEKIALLRSFKNEMPELYIMDNKPGAEPERITYSPTDEFTAYDWRVPELIKFEARDGANVPARLYKPEEPNNAAVIFVHGAGYLQNAHRWWSTYFREYMFHNLLADKGYTVLDIDYRGSAGLGRDWRTAIYTHMGGKDLDDHIDGANYLIDEHSIDPERIGIYGGSYGGFIVFMAMFTDPGVFAAGAALRPVADWAHYSHGYTSNILDIPFKNPEHYRRSSPIYHAGGFEGALLMTAPMIDTNVHFQDVVRLSQRLIELGKENWEVALYPVEDHSFVEPSSWKDQYRRILNLFEETLLQ